MRINPSVNGVNFSSNINKDTVSVKKKTVDRNDVEISHAVIRDYNVKLPQKYSKTDTVTLPDNLTAHVYKLESGQRVVVIPKDGPTVIKTYVNTGALNETDSERGISHFVEHSLFNGSDGLKEGEFFETVNKMGANTNASTGFSATDYYIKSNLLNDNDLEKQVKIHASMIETPKFTPEMIEKEKGPVTSEISMILDDVENVAVNSTIKNLFNIKTKSEDIIGGTIENINNLTREKVQKYYKQNYYPANMVTVITGDVNEKDAINLVSKYMHSKASAPDNRKFEVLEPINSSIRKDIISDKTPASFVSIGLKGPKNNELKDHIIFDAVTYLLTESTLSRINKSLENIQTEAYVNIERLSSRPTDSTAILIGCEVDEKNSESAIKKINKALESVKTNPPDDEELGFIKKNLKFDFANKFESSSDINSMVGGAMLDGDISIISDYEKIIDSLTPKNIVEFANKYLDTSKQAVTVVHPSKNNTKVSFGSRKPVDTDKVDTKTLQNNILLLEKTTDKNVVYADFKLLNQEDNNDVASSLLLSGLLERGSSTKSKDEFYQKAEKDGILLGFSADNNSISVSSTFMKQDTKKAFEYIKEVLSNPRFTQEDFEEVKKQVVQNLKDMPVSAKEGLYSEIFKGQAKGVTKEQLLKSLDEIKLSDVKKQYDNLMKNIQMHSAVSGPFSDINFKNSVEEELSSFSAVKKAEIIDKKSYVPVEKTKVIIQPHNKSQAEIIAGYKFKINDNSPEKMIRYSLLNIILGGTASSRLFNDLREAQKLAYHVKSSLDYNDSDTGVCSLYIKTTTDNKSNYKNIEKSINGFDKHVKKLLSERISQEELENAKLVFKNRMYNDNETTGRKNSTILSNVNTKTGIELTNNVMNIVDSISTEDIMQAAEEMFGGKPVYSVVAKKEALSNNAKYLDSLQS